MSLDASATRPLRLPLLRALEPRTRAGLSEILRLHIVIVVAATVLGYAFQQFVLAGPTPPPNAQRYAESHLIASTNAELLWILRTNLVFFLLVSVLPVLNLFFVLPQAFTLGVVAGLIADERWDARFNLLYRHAVFEVIALLAAITASYVLLGAIRAFTRADHRDVPELKNRLRPLIPLYLIVVGCTVIGAVLEGNAVVRI